jgi:hypothetical protein
MQIAHVAHVQQIEVPIGQRDAFAIASPFIHAPAKLVTSQDFLLSGQSCPLNEVS